MIAPAPLVYLNGRFLPSAEAALPLHDAGFVMGATVTDFCRTYNRILFRWPDHLARFRRNCGTCFIPLPQTDAELTAIAEELIAHNGRLLTPGQELALITFATPGPIGYYLGEPGGAGDGPPTLGMHTFPLPFARYRRFFEQGVTLVFAGNQAESPNRLLPLGVKHRSRLPWWIAERIVRDATHFPPHALALLSDAAGRTVTETAIGNFLLVRAGTVVTPPRDRILNGVSLHVVEELCHALDIPFAEAEIPLAECVRAEEAILCGTAFGLAGVSRIQDGAIPWPGSVCTRLLAAWSARVGVDIRRQFLPHP